MRWAAEKRSSDVRRKIMRICFYANSFLPLVGGAEMVLHHLAMHLAQRGEGVVVFAPEAHGPGHGAAFSYPVYRYARPFSKRFGVHWTLVPLVRLHRRHRFELLHCHSSYPPAYVGATFKTLSGIPLVIRPHGADILPDGRIRRHARLAKRLRRALAAADAVIAQGHFMRHLIRDLGVAEHRIHTIHNGVDLAAFATGTPFPHPRPYLLGMGKFMRHKGFDVLLHVYARLPDPTPDLLLAGTGPEQPALEALTRQLGIAQRVRFLGFVEGQRKVNLLRSATFFVCPSRREPFANVILEAMAAGLPVVASAVGGNTELVYDGVHGLLFPAEDDAALACALQRLLAEPALLQRLRTAVPGFVRDFDWPRIAAQYLALYQDTVGQCLRPAYLRRGLP
jgi:L-malate glycosyltransferase